MTNPMYLNISDALTYDGYSLSLLHVLWVHTEVRHMVGSNANWDRPRRVLSRASAMFFGTNFVTYFCTIKREGDIDKSSGTLYLHFY